MTVAELWVGWPRLKKIVGSNLFICTIVLGPWRGILLDQCKPEKWKSIAFKNFCHSTSGWEGGAHAKLCGNDRIYQGPRIFLRPKEPKICADFALPLCYCAPKFCAWLRSMEKAATFLGSNLEVDGPNFHFWGCLSVSGPKWDLTPKWATASYLCSARRANSNVFFVELKTIELSLTLLLGP